MQNKYSIFQNTIILNFIIYIYLSLNAPKGGIPGLEKQKLRPCPICRSRKWHMMDGHLVCESGHNYEVNPPPLGTLNIIIHYFEYTIDLLTKIV